MCANALPGCREAGLRLRLNHRGTETQRLHRDSGDGWDSVRLVRCVCRFELPLGSEGGRIEDASLQNSSCCSSSCLLPSLRPLTRDYIVDVGTLAPYPTQRCYRLLLLSFYGRTCLTFRPRESPQVIRSGFAAYARPMSFLGKLGALRGLRALHRLRRADLRGRYGVSVPLALSH